MSPQDEARLRTVDLRVASRIARVLTAMDALGHPMCVTAGARTAEEQHRLYEQGRTAPGDIVTNADGIVKRSRHQDGYAVDCAFLENGQASWAEHHPWTLYGACVRAVGLEWGGDWPTFPDRPHAELPKGDR